MSKRNLLEHSVKEYIYLYIFCIHKIQNLYFVK